MKLFVSASKTPSGAIIETDASTKYGIIEGSGTNKITSLVKVVVLVAVPETPFASVYSTSMGTVIVV